MMCQRMLSAARCPGEVVTRIFTNTGSLMVCEPCQQVLRIRGLAEAMEKESPKPGAGGWFAEELFNIVGR